MDAMSHVIHPTRVPAISANSIRKKPCIGRAIAYDVTAAATAVANKLIICRSQDSKTVGRPESLTTSFADLLHQQQDIAQIGFVKQIKHRTYEWNCADRRVQHYV
jgi:hypothetical protein